MKLGTSSSCRFKTLAMHACGIGMEKGDEVTVLEYEAAVARVVI